MKWLVQVPGCEKALTVEILSDNSGHIEALVDDKRVDFQLTEFSPGRLLVNGGNSVRVIECRGRKGQVELIDQVGALSMQILDERDTWLGKSGARESSGTVAVAMPGRVVKVMVKSGDSVVQGDCLCVIEAMKMENDVRAPIDGVVSGVLVEAGDAVNAGQTLIELD
jgi:biotin carboxyl carrier protein